MAGRHAETVLLFRERVTISETVRLSADEKARRVYNALANKPPCIGPRGTERSLHCGGIWGSLRRLFSGQDRIPLPNSTPNGFRELALTSVRGGGRPCVEFN